MPPVEELTWQSIDDFSPGIFTAPGTNHPLGAATDDTYRCVAAENGALIPGPKVTYAIDHAPFEDDPEDIFTEDNKYWIGGLFANPAAVYGGLGNPYPGAEQNNTELFIGFEWYTETENRRVICRYRRNYEDPGDRWQTLVNVTTGAVVNDYTRPNRFFAASTRSNPSDTTVAGQPIMAFTYNGGDTAVVFPDPTTPTTNATDALPEPAGGILYMLTGHQGRLVCTPFTTYADGTGQVSVSNEALYWTPVQNHTIIDTNLSSNYYNVVAGFENPTGYADIKSLTADELFLLKINGGALILRGSLNDPLAVTLPYVQSPGINMCTGAVSPAGYVYVVKGGGVWVWAGGDNAEYVSPQMDDGFWQPTTDFYEDDTPATGSYYWHYADCHAWQEWVVLPSSYVWDWRRNAYFRIAERDLFFYTSSPDKRFLYGARARFDHESRFVIWEFDRLKGASSWQWTSQFIPGTILRQTNVRMIEVVASGYGTVTVTPMCSRDDDSGATPWATHTGEVASDDPVVIGQFPCAVQGTHLQFKINAEASDGSEGYDAGPAPTVYALRWGTSEGLHVTPGR